MARDGNRDDTTRDRDPDNIFDAGLRGLARGLEGLRGIMSQIADPTAPARPQPVSGPGRRPPRQAQRGLASNNAGVREPAVDIFDEGDLIRVVADMPGVDPDTLRVRGVGDRLAIAATGPARRYERLVALPAPVRAEEAAPPTLINGILELLLPVDRPAQQPSATPPILPTTTPQG